MLSIERKKRLENLGFVWDAFEFKWEVKFNELIAYKAGHGDTNVPRDYPNGLGVWIKTQRALSIKGELPTERKVRLDEVGFEWDLFEQAWEAKFNELLAYKNEYGHVNVPNGLLARV